MKCSIPQRIRKAPRKNRPRGMHFSNAFTTVAKEPVGDPYFSGRLPATKKAPPDRASALPALVHKPPLGGFVTSNGRYSNTNEPRMTAPSSNDANRADISSIMEAAPATRSAPKTQARVECPGTHAAFGKTRV